MCITAHLLTASRLVLLVPILVLLGEGSTPERYALAFGLFLLGGLTDFLDGWVARRAGCVSAIGTFFDPLADKIFANLLLVLLTCHHPDWVPLWVVLLLLARELAVQGLRGMAPCVGVLIRTGWVSKLKLVFQLIALGAALGGLAWAGAAPVLRPATWVALGLAVATGLWSMIELFWRHADLWRRDPLVLEER